MKEKNKKNYLKVACAIEFLYIIIFAFYMLFFKKITDEVIANLFMLLISFILTFTLFKESKKDLKEISKLKVSLISFWMLLDCVLPGILGFVFLGSLKGKKEVKFPLVKEEKKTFKTYVKSLVLLFVFLFFLIGPNYIKPLRNLNSLFTYVVIIGLIILFYYRDIKENFVVFIKNFKIYKGFIIKRYFIMLGVMLLSAIPVIILNNGATSENQQMINAMFKSLPLFTFLLSTIYAPFAEEMIFRLSLSKLFSNKYLFIIISGVLFGALHVIDKFTSFYDLLFIFEYSALGICLAKAYSDSKNIFVSMSMHFIQNFIAGILVLLLY